MKAFIKSQFGYLMFSQIRTSKNIKKGNGRGITVNTDMREQGEGESKIGHKVCTY